MPQDGYTGIGRQYAFGAESCFACSGDPDPAFERVVFGKQREHQPGGLANVFGVAGKRNTAGRVCVRTERPLAFAK
jgi:hypothetical protein